MTSKQQNPMLMDESSMSSFVGANDTESSMRVTLDDSHSGNSGLKLCIRDGPHLQDTDHKEPNFIFPPLEQIRWDNPIVGFVQKPGNWCGMNVIMKDGQQSRLPLNMEGGKGYFPALIRPQGATVSKVIMKGDTEFGGCIFLDDQDRTILQSGHIKTLC